MTNTQENTDLGNTTMLDFNDFAGKFGGWADLFRPFIEGKEMFDIYQKIKKDAEKEVILPYSEDTFKVFAKTYPPSVKSIWYLMDPYPRRYRNRVPQATGIAMDCSNSPDGKLQPSLDVFYDAIEKNIGKQIARPASLDYLLYQGVMLTNTDLTLKMNKTGSHERLWEPFQKFFLEEIMGSRQGIVYVLAGKASHRLDRYIQPIGNHIIKLEHPAAAHRNHVDWECKGIFTTINKILKQQGNEQIEWDAREWERLAEAPF